MLLNNSQSLYKEGHDINAQQTVSAAKATKEYLQRLRSQSAYEHFYKAIVTDSEDLTDEPTLPRQKVPRRLDEGTENHRYVSTNYFFQQQYFEVLNVLIRELNERFS